MDVEGCGVGDLPKVHCKMVHCTVKQFGDYINCPVCRKKHEVIFWVTTQMSQHIYTSIHLNVCSSGGIDFLQHLQ